MKNSKWGLAGSLFVAALLTGCASVPMAPPAADQEAKQFQVAQNQAKIYVYRNETLGAALKMPLTLNGKAVGDTGPKTYYVFDVAPGKYTLTSQGDESTVTVDAVAGNIYYVWQEVKMGLMSGGSKLQVVDATKGQAGVKESKLAQSK